MKELKSALTAFFITAGVFCSLISLLGIFLIPARVGSPEKPVGETVSGIDYNSAPEPVSIAVVGADQTAALIYLGFKTISVDVYLFESAEQLKGAEADYYMELPSGFLGKLCDRMGGLTLSNSGSDELFFGVALEHYATQDNSIRKMTEISNAFFKKIAKMGLSSEDFMFIIENTETNLNYPACYDMMEYIPELFGNCYFR